MKIKKGMLLILVKTLEHVFYVNRPIFIIVCISSFANFYSWCKTHFDNYVAVIYVALISNVYYVHWILIPWNDNREQQQ